MDARDLSTTKSLLDIALTKDIQQGRAAKSGTLLEEHVSLFGQFVSAVSSDTLTDIRPRSEFSTFVRDFCLNAPCLAQHLAKEILKQSRDDSQPQASKKVGSVKPSWRSNTFDRTYQPPKSCKVQPDIPAKDSHKALAINSVRNDQPIICRPSDNNKTFNHSGSSLVAEKPPLKYEGDVPMVVAERVPHDEVQSQPATGDHTKSSMGIKSALHPLKAPKIALYEHPSAMIDKATENNQTIVSLPSPSGDAKQETALQETDRKTSDSQATSAPSSPNKIESHETILLDATPSTPIQQINGGFQSPTFAAMVARSVHTIYDMSRLPEVPTKVHSKILATIRPSGGEVPATATVVDRPEAMPIASNPKDWSATMWINMLEASHTRSKNATILNMIEWIGASEWYDAELQKSKNKSLLTKRGKLRKRLATTVLDEYLNKARDTTFSESTENPALEDNRDCLSSVNSVEIQKKILDAKRKRLNNLFHRGRTLRKLIQLTNLGILFDPDIWSYAKGSKENIDKVAANFQADPQKIELLSILGKQVERLAQYGRPDLSRFFDSLESYSIMPSEEVSSLRAEYGLEGESVPPGSLESAIDRVNKEIHKVLGEESCGDDDFIIVNGVELSCSMIDRLRSREWLKCWDIGAALEMADRPVFVELSLSIPLHKEDANGNVTPIPNPFRRWRLKIDEYRRKDKENLKGLRVYICPLNVNANHFTLLEINEQTKMIYHYDSWAGNRIIQRKTKSTLVKRVVEEEFKYLGFGYDEARTPQQEDGWSCGLMAIRNAKRRMLGLSVGTWSDKVDPDRVIKEVVGDCQTFLDDNALQPRTFTKKRKKIVEPEQSRRSKRLKK